MTFRVIIALQNYDKWLIFIGVHKSCINWWTQTQASIIYMMLQNEWAPALLYTKGDLVFTLQIRLSPIISIQLEPGKFPIRTEFPSFSHFLLWYWLVHLWRRLGCNIACKDEEKGKTVPMETWGYSSRIDWLGVCNGWSLKSDSVGCSLILWISLTNLLAFTVQSINAN